MDGGVTWAIPRPGSACTCTWCLYVLAYDYSIYVVHWYWAGTVWRNHAWNHRRDTFASIRAGHTSRSRPGGGGPDRWLPVCLSKLIRPRRDEGLSRPTTVYCDLRSSRGVRLLYFKLRFSAVQGAALIFHLNNNQIARVHWFMVLLTWSGTKHRNIKHACVHP